MKKKERKIAIKKQILTLRFISIFLFVFIVTLFFVLTDSSLFQPKVNEETFKYISFNNRNTTDMLQINDIKRMSDDRGKSNKNKKFIEFSATGEKNLDYDVILYPIINAIDYKYIKYSITNQKKLIIDTLEDKEKSEDGGIIIYQGKIKENQLRTLRLWISKDYVKKVESNSFEVRIKSRGEK